jgi:hypothetical protein
LAEAQKVINRPRTKIERIVFAPINLSGDERSLSAPLYGAGKGGGLRPVPAGVPGEDAITRCQ